MSDVIGAVFLVVGILFNVLGCIGLIRLPDIYNRLQAATKCVTMGTCMVLVSVVIFSGFGASAGISVKGLLCMVFVLITAPTAAHALAQGSHASGVRLWEKSVVDRYREDNEPGIDHKEPPKQ